MHIPVGCILRHMKQRTNLISLFEYDDWFSFSFLLPLSLIGIDH
jgi:hypothetical protein